MPRILSIWLPQLPLDRRVRLEDPRLSGPFAITSEAQNAWRITHANLLAVQAGVRPGQPLADARAICPDLLSEPADPVREEGMLRALWRWADCLSPRVALDAPDGLLLDVSGCAHLFGGEAAMGEYAIARLSDLHVMARIGVADTKGAARALARFADRPVAIAPAGQTAGALAALPIAALDLPEQIRSDLARTGLTSIGQLYAQKSGELARRFGLSLTQALSAATGQRPDPVTPKAADPVYAARMTLPEPIGLVEDLHGVLERLAGRVCDRLQADHKGARAFHLVVRCVDTGDHHLSIGFARPCVSPEPVLRQFAHPLSLLKIEFGADWFRLSATGVEPIRLRQMSHGENARQEDHRLRLIETLGNRIGFDHVRIFRPADRHLPEHEFERVEAVHHGEVQPWRPPARPRPLRLFRPPEYVQVETPGRPPRAFIWRRVSFRTHAAQGPERLTPRWHADEDLRTRDYWRIQTEEGRRLWLLTYPGHGHEDWFVAGEFA